MTKSDSIDNKNIIPFNAYFPRTKAYEDGAELDEVILSDAEKIYETLKTPKAIRHFGRLSTAKRNELVPGLQIETTSLCLKCAYIYALRYAEYVQANQPSSAHERLKESSAPKDTQKADILQHLVQHRRKGMND